ncbi:hypothetical protein HFO52_14125 [Rhizobium leguminosarum]|nr:hypothetical protein [Rhizobium leguminosarum]MBY5644024.1 hypothetical protein [Rhizobium leguminosarum]
MEALFEWLLKGTGTGDQSLDIRLALEIWEFEAVRAKARGNGDYGEYDLPSQNLGYDVLTKLAELCLAAPAEEQRRIWESVLKHGPVAHYALHQFIDGLYVRLGEGDDPTAFQFVWREMANYGLAASWSTKGLWFHGERLLGDILGFGNAEALQLLPSAAALQMKDVYERWARGHLDANDECIDRFCYFLSSPFGSPLRLDGLSWTSTALRAREGYWYRDETGAALAHLVATSLQADAAALGSNSEARQALLDIAAMLVSKNVPTALALQERIKRVGLSK